MTYKEKREFLNGYAEAKMEIIGALSEIERWEAVGAKMNQVLEYRPGGNNLSNENKSRVEQAAVEVMTIIEKIRPEIDEAEEKKRNILNAIEKHSRYRRQRNLLFWKYIRMMSNDEIAAAIGKDLRTVRHALRKAIMDLDV